MNIKQCHPFASFLFFAVLLAFIMFISNPVITVLSVISGLIFLVTLGAKIKLRDAVFYFLLILASSVVNPMFVHKGETVLFFLNDNPITAEAFLYGADIGASIVGIIIWFRCFNIVMTNEKILFLFGKILPKTAFVISSAMGFIPTIKLKAEEIKTAEKVMGIFSGDTLYDRMKATAYIYSILITFAFENAVEMGSAMKSRCYGNNKPVYYSAYNWKKSDTLFSAVYSAIFLMMLYFTARGFLSFQFYPTASYSLTSEYAFIPYLSFLAVCLLPSILNIKEELIWKYYISRI